MFGCVHAPDFAVQAALLRESKSLPLALFDGPESQLKVVACNAPARAAGVSTGMSKLQAEARGVILRRRIQEHEDAAQAELTDSGYNFSPHIEVTNPGTVIIDYSENKNPEFPEKGRVLPPEVTFQVRVDLDAALTEEQWEKLTTGEAIMCAYGFVEYQDAFKREKRTRFCYVYGFGWGGVITTPDGTVLNPPGFRIGGPPVYNEAT